MTLKNNIVFGTAMALNATFAGCASHSIPTTPVVPGKTHMEAESAFTNVVFRNQGNGSPMRVSLDTCTSDGHIAVLELPIAVDKKMQAADEPERLAYYRELSKAMSAVFEETAEQNNIVARIDSRNKRIKALRKELEGLRNGDIQLSEANLATYGSLEEYIETTEEDFNNKNYHLLNDLQELSEPMLEAVRSVDERLGTRTVMAENLFDLPDEDDQRPRYATELYGCETEVNGRSPAAHLKP